MNTSDAEPLDVEELMHLALRYAGENQPGKAISSLKRVLEITPNHGKAHYFIGALHADIGMYERAIDDMQAAVKYEPGFPIAAFQLGLLYITSGKQVEAKSIWKKLDKLGESDPLFLFKRGISQLVENNYQQCIDDLEKGILLNTSNENLNIDMQRLIDAAHQAIINTTTDQTSDHSTSGKQTLLSAYQRSSYESE